MRIGAAATFGVLVTGVSVLMLASGVEQGAVMNTPARDAVSFTGHIAPILRSNCLRCHDGESAKGGFSVTSREAMLADPEVIVPGDAAASRMIGLISGNDPLLVMPPEGERLSADEVRIITRWIDEGAIWDGPLHGGIVRARPVRPRRVEVPPAHGEVTNPIDLLLEPYFDEHNVKPAGVVDDGAFLRRASLDVLGLLPSPRVLGSFVSDANPDKRAAIVRDMLSDRRNYAEHWLTLWNDLLRNDYAGTGYIDGGRTQITRWLYDSLLKNKPYNDFVAELVNPHEGSAGFARGIKWRGEVNASQRRELQYAQNVAQVFLGINMKCASCHDSFVDGWKLADAYGMAAVLAENPLELHRCDSPIGEVARASFPFAEVGTIDADAPVDERLAQFAALLVHSENGRLARTVVNRIWQRLMGRALVEPVDAMAEPAWNEDLLDLLANHLREHDYDIKQVIELIVTSQAYQRHAVDGAGEGAVFTFAGPTPQRMTSEQFVDAVWSITGAGPIAPDAPIAQRALQSKWIWSTEDASTARPAGEEIEFVRLFIVQRMPVAAHAVITCDNEYRLSINGTVIGSDNAWQTVETYDIARHLKDGGNEVRIVARNAGQGPNPAGLFFEAVLAFEDGSQRQIGTDEDWIWTEHARTEPLRRANAWPRAQVLENQQFLGGDINAHLATAIASVTSQDHFVRASLMNADRLMSVLGRPSRDQVVTTRPSDLSTLQALELTNGETMNAIAQHGAAVLLDQFQDPAKLVRHIFVAALSRKPSNAELSLALDLLGDELMRDSVADLLWAVFMLPEFQMVRHGNTAHLEVDP